MIARGLVAGAAAGAFAGLLDAARALGSANEMQQPADAFAVVVFYAAVFAPLGIVAASLARRADWPHRMLDLLVALGTAWFLVVAWANVAWLPGMTSGLALAFDAAALVAALIVLRVRYRAPGEDRPHTARWALLGAASVGLALLLPHVVERRGDGPAPEAAALPGAKRPNVLLYLVDTLRADHLGCYGYAKPTSPEVDAFAKDAVRFEDCRAPSSWTKPSVASLFTGTYPSTHACVELRETLVPEAETLAEVFAAAGWRTGAFVDNPMVSREFGFGQGFGVYDEEAPSVLAMGTLLGKALWAAGLMPTGGRERGAAVLHERFEAFAAARDERPWFAYVHAMEPHEPYEPARADAVAMGLAADAAYEAPPAHGGILPFHATPAAAPGVRERLVAQYDGEIRGWSRAFGKLVDGLRARGELESTVVVLVADHGEEFHEHGGWTHGHSLHREVVQVPFVVRVPDLLGDTARAGRGRAVGGTTTLLDVAPTLYELCGVAYPRGAEPGRPGRSLAQNVLGPKPAGHVAVDRPILGEVTQQLATLRSVRRGRWLLVRASEPLRSADALYDDVSDPAHRRDRASDQPVEVRELGALLDDAFRRLASIALTGRSKAIDPETAEALRRLGYLGR